MHDETPYANSLFEQPWWLDIVAPGKWGEVFVKEGTEVVARLPYVIDKKKICMPPNTQTLGPWIKKEYRIACNGNSQLTKQKEIIKELLDQLPKHKSFKICMDSSNEYVLPYRWLGYRYEPTFSYRIDNISDMENVYGNFSKSLKKNIRRAERKVEITEDNDPEVLMYAIDKTFENQHRKNPLNSILIRKILQECDKYSNGKMFVARDSNKNIQVASYMVYDSNVAYAILSGSDPQYRGSESKSYIYWKQIQYASTTSKVFDFEGSNIEGIENIVRQFGGRRVTNYNVIKQSLIKDCIDMAKPRIKRLIGYKI